MSSRTDSRRAQGPLTLGPRHDLRAWTVFLLLAALMLSTVTMADSARAQLPELPDLPAPIPGGGGSEEPDPGSSEPPGGSGAPVNTSGIKTAYFTSPTSDLTAGAATDDAVQCVIIPETCTPDAQQITGPIRDGVAEGQGGGDTATEPVPQPVPPGALPVGLLNGNQRYSTAVGIGPPTVAPGNTVDAYLVSFTFSDQSFSIESPAFRAFTTAAVSQAGTGGPEQFEAFFGGIQNGETDLFTQDFPGLEACVIAAPWEAGDNQPVANQPEVDFFNCSAQAKPDENGIVTFDLTFPAQLALSDDPDFGLDWSNGILIRPLAAQNLAYGDADYTTNYYAYLQPLSENPPSISQQEVAEPTLPPTTPPRAPGSGGSAPGSSGSSGSGGFGGSGGSTSRPSSGSSGSVPSRPSSPGAPVTTSGPAIPPPADFGGSDAAGGDQAAESFADQPAVDAGVDPFAPTNDQAAGSFPIAWILLPMILGGAFWYGRVLDGAPTAVVLRTSGAMTRLLRQRGFQV